MIVYEKLGEVYGYMHEGMMHINEDLPPYMRAHVREYFRTYEGDRELKVYFKRAVPITPTVAREMQRRWTGDIYNHLMPDEVADLMERMRATYPELAHLPDNDLIEHVISLCNG